MARGYPDFEGGKVALYTVADWAAKEGTVIVRSTFDADVDFLGFVTIPYLVEEGHTFYLTFVSGICVPNDENEGDSNQICGIEVAIAALMYPSLGGNGGASACYTPPIRVTEGQILAVNNRSYADHNVTLWVGLLGYLIEN